MADAGVGGRRRGRSELSGGAAEIEMSRARAAFISFPHARLVS